MVVVEVQPQPGLSQGRASLLEREPIFEIRRIDVFYRKIGCL